MKLPIGWRRARAAERDGSPRIRGGQKWQRLALGCAVCVLLASVLAGQYWMRGAASAASPVTVPVTRGDLRVTVESSGSVRPVRQVDLRWAGSGSVREVLVAPGQQVAAGEALARLDDTELQLKLQQAEADLASARAKLVAAREGSATPEELAQAEAQVAGAAAQLQQTRSGKVTAADIANAEAVVRGAEANLRRVRQAAPAEIAEAAAAVRAAEANLERTRTGNVSGADLAEAGADVRAAEARVREADSGATTAEASAAELALREAEVAYQYTAAAASTAKTAAERDLQTSADRVRSAQDRYSAAYWADQQAQSGVDPTTGQRFEERGEDPAIAQRRYADELREAERQLRGAESALEGARVAHEQAQAAEVRDVVAAQARLDNARAQHDAVLAGASERVRVEAQAQLDQAQARLQRLQAGGTRADVAAAEAQLDQARARLRKLQQGGTEGEIAAAEVQLDQARAGLAKLRQGGTAAEIAAAQAQLDGAQASLAQLTAPEAPSAIATAEAQVAQAEAQVAAARLALEDATLVAPFAGTVASVAVVPGSLAGNGAGAAITLVDLGAMYVDVEVGETDVAGVAPGQTAEISFDAWPDQTVSGTVASVAPTADEGDDLVTYAVRVEFAPGAIAVKAGMTAYVAIETERHAGVLQVPSRAITRNGPVASVEVLAEPGQPPITIPVRTGATDGSATEIVACVPTGEQCLREGDQLVLPDPVAAAGPQAQGADMVITGAPMQAVPGDAPQRIQIEP